jgi:NAD(P)-dependent dehydrogenase (short-subunit alcohol dehydrogenase family)
MRKVFPWAKWPVCSGLAAVLNCAAILVELDALERFQVTRLAGKVALITGGGTGIGRACAVRFAAEGAKVAVAGRRKELLAGAVNEISGADGEAIAIPCDVSRTEEVEHAVRSVVERFGRLNVVVNNAGAMTPGTAEQTTDAHFDLMISANLKSAFLVSRAALGPMRAAGGGSIINIGSILGLVGMKNRVAYAAAKGGVTLMTKCMALDHAKENIRVNCICPSLVETEIARALFAAAPDPEAAKRERLSSVPMGRAGKPEEIAALAAYLASDEAAWVTGSAISIDGGHAAA